MSGKGLYIGWSAKCYRNVVEKYYKKNGVEKCYKKNGVGKKTELEWKVLRGMECRDCSNEWKGSYRKLMPTSLCRMLKLQRKAVRNILTGTAKCDCQFFEKSQPERR